MATQDDRDTQASRTCANTRERKDPSTMVRLVLSQDGSQVAVDISGKAPGRGVWVTAQRDVFLEALSPKRLGRTFRGRVRTLEEGEAERLLEQTIQRLETSMLQLVSLTRRAGELLVGMDAVAAAVGDLDFVLILAEDVSPRSARKAAEKAHPGATTVRLSSMTKLGSMLGRTDVGVLGLRRSKLATRLVAESARRAGLMGASSPNEETV